MRTSEEELVEHALRDEERCAYCGDWYKKGEMWQNEYLDPGKRPLCIQCIRELFTQRVKEREARQEKIMRRWTLSQPR